MFNFDDKWNEGYILVGIGEKISATLCLTWHFTFLILIIFSNKFASNQTKSKMWNSRIVNKIVEKCNSFRIICPLVLHWCMECLEPNPTGLVIWTTMYLVREKLKSSFFEWRLLPLSWQNWGMLVPSEPWTPKLATWNS